MDKILITGSGMLATALMEQAPRFGFQTQAMTRRQADLRDRTAVVAAAQAAGPAMIIHTAAETRVNYCEDHAQEALAVNATGTANVGFAAAACQARLVYVSTDYVFNGDKAVPWVESDEPQPLNSYGFSKLQGEKAVLSYELGTIVRTSGVFGKRGGGNAERNFFRAIAAKLDQEDQLVEVVADQITAVTYAPHLATMLLRTAQTGLPRITHLTSAGEDSWFGWARRAARILGCDPQRIKPAKTTVSAGTVARPLYSVLGSEIPEIAAMIREFPAEEGLRKYLTES